MIYKEISSSIDMDYDVYPSIVHLDVYPPWAWLLPTVPEENE